ncbi:AurF N-oxygenase family protein [Millisia brevis]|uniref:AurF N-oxygenase family protein n=1 Tax=Millisia brevis TaxID=264148 RepID=UPI0009FE75BD|nr:diiron oxygenase [Millisia brevis]
MVAVSPDHAQGPTREGPSSNDEGDAFVGEYYDNLRLLSEGSVNRHFDAYTDIDWQSPEFAVIEDDERWILPATDPLGGHPWYLAAPRDLQIEIGRYRQANVAKVGLQFEGILVGGFMNYATSLTNGDPEYRYCLHESAEECNHMMMFQEMVNRVDRRAAGMNRVLRFLAPFIPLAAKGFPTLFFIGVLAGEEPIDHTQKAVLREGGNLHPIMRRVMQIHVAEEARHISFAHQWIERRVPRLGRAQRFLVSLALPIIMRVLADAIMIPPKSFWERFDIPEQVRKDLFWTGSRGRGLLTEVFADVRMLADRAGLRTPLAKLVWRALLIDGRSSRFRSEPQRGPGQHIAA